MLNKAINGGTNNRAKLGYRNATVTIDGHKVNTIEIDQERAKYVVMAFELWATGNYANAEALQTALTDAGLRMPATGKPVSTQTLWKLLRDRYYLGYVTYKGIEYPGRHQPLISEELFDQAQTVLNSHSGTGTRRPWRRILLLPLPGQARGTLRPALCAMEVMEAAVAQHYATTAWLPAELRQQVRLAVDAAVASHHGLSDELRASLTAQLAKGERKESYLIDLAAEEDWPKDVLRQKIQAIRDERTRIRRHLEQSTNQLEAGRQVFTTALALLDDPHSMYQAGNETVRSILNRAFFTRLYIDGTRVTGQKLREPFDVLHEASTIYRHQQTDRQRTSGERRTYHRTHGSVAVTGELMTIRNQLELPAWSDPAQTAHSAVLPEEYGAAEDLHTAATREDASRDLTLVFSDQGWSSDGMVGHRPPLGPSRRDTQLALVAGHDHLDTDQPLRENIAGRDQIRASLPVRLPDELHRRGRLEQRARCP